MCACAHILPFVMSMRPVPSGSWSIVINDSPVRHEAFQYHASQVISASKHTARVLSVSEDEVRVLESLRPSRRFVSTSHSLGNKR